MCDLRLTDSEVIVARSRLSCFVVTAANHQALNTGFTWRKSLTPPTTFPALQQEYQASSQMNLPLQVHSGQARNGGIYDHEAANASYRFWHDTNHVQLDKGFSAADEMTVSYVQLDGLLEFGFNMTGMEYKLLHADTVGQVHCYSDIGRYPFDRLGFAIACAADGVETAIRHEAMKRPPAPKLAPRPIPSSDGSL